VLREVARAEHELLAIGADLDERVDLDALGAALGRHVPTIDDRR
jgi:hypothetical protein